MEPSKLFAYLIAAILSLSLAYIIGKLRWPLWALWSFAIVCFVGSVLIVALGSWSPESPWPSAIRIGLASVAGATAGLGLRGGGKRVEAA